MYITGTLRAQSQGCPFDRRRFHCYTHVYRLAGVSVVSDRTQLRTRVDIIGGPCRLPLKGSQDAVPEQEHGQPGKANPQLPSQRVIDTTFTSCDVAVQSLARSRPGKCRPPDHQVHASMSCNASVVTAKLITFEEEPRAEAGPGSHSSGKRHTPRPCGFC